MMNIEEYIESGILELYVYGLLNTVQKEEVIKMAEQYEEINNEIIAIEKALVLISESVAPNLSSKNYVDIKNTLLRSASNSILSNASEKLVDANSNKNGSSTKYIGWILALLIALGSYYYYDLLQKDSLNKQKALEKEKKELNFKVIKLNSLNEEAENLISIFRDTSNFVVALQGQDVAPKAFAKIFWNKNTKTIYIDALGLPNPPEGMVYQVWSFKLDPLVPTSLGILDTYKKNNRKFFKVKPSEESQAFGISIEPSGGSETPTLEQLFTLGKV
jgi:anti-sigma-K factor RskA